MSAHGCLKGVLHMPCGTRLCPSTTTKDLTLWATELEHFQLAGKAGLDLTEAALYYFCATGIPVAEEFWWLPVLFICACTLYLTFLPLRSHQNFCFLFPGPGSAGEVGETYPVHLPCTLGMGTAHFHLVTGAVEL